MMKKKEKKIDSQDWARMLNSGEYENIARTYYETCFKGCLIFRKKYNVTNDDLIDLYHEAWLKIIKSKSAKNSDNFCGYIAQVVKNLILKQEIKDRKLNVEYKQDLSELDSKESNEQNEIIDNQIVNKILSALGDSCKELLKKFFIEKRKFQEIAKEQIRKEGKAETDEEVKRIAENLRQQKNRCVKKARKVFNYEDFVRDEQVGNYSPNNRYDKNEDEFQERLIRALAIDWFREEYVNKHKLVTKQKVRLLNFGYRIAASILFILGATVFFWLNLNQNKTYLIEKEIVYHSSSVQGKPESLIISWEKEIPENMRKLDQEALLFSLIRDDTLFIKGFGVDRKSLVNAKLLYVDDNMLILSTKEKKFKVKTNSEIFQPSLSIDIID